MSHQTQYYHNHKERCKISNLKSRYNMTDEDIKLIIELNRQMKTNRDAYNILSDGKKNIMKKYNSKYYKRTGIKTGPKNTIIIKDNKK